MSKLLKIDSCTECPHHSSDRDWTPDSWETCFKWKCDLLKEPVRRYVDWNDHDNFIPKECPLDSNKNIKKKNMNTEKKLVDWFKNQRKQLVKSLKIDLDNRNHQGCVTTASKIDYIDHVLSEITDIGGTLHGVFNDE